MFFNDMLVQGLLYGVEVWGGNTSFSACNEIEKIVKLLLYIQLGIKFSTSYHVMLLETSTSYANNVQGYYKSEEYA